MSKCERFYTKINRTWMKFAFEWVRVFATLCLIVNFLEASGKSAQALSASMTAGSSFTFSQAADSKKQFPLLIEVIPGKLKVRVWLHDINSRFGLISCWSYVTEGLKTHNQKELIFTISVNPKDKAEDYPQDPLDFFKNTYQSASEGKIVNIGDITELGAKGVLGRQDFRAITYAEPSLFKKHRQCRDPLDRICIGSLYRRHAAGARCHSGRYAVRAGLRL